MTDDAQTQDTAQDQGGGEVDYERAASEIGWAPKEKFRGNPDSWVDAKTFYDRGQTVLPIIKKDRDRLNADLNAVRGELATTQRLLADTVTAQEEFKKYHEETAKREYERALTRLKDEKRSALKEGDADAVVEIDDAITKLHADNAPKPKSEPAAVATPAAFDPTRTEWFREWHAQNSDWFGEAKDPDRTAYALSISQYIRQTNPTMLPRDLLAKVTDEVQKRFAGNGRRAESSRVEGSRGGESQQRGGRKSYADLPADAKEACDRFGAKVVGPTKTYKSEDDWRKRYVADYFGDQ